MSHNVKNPRAGLMPSDTDSPRWDNLAGPVPGAQVPPVVTLTDEELRREIKRAERAVRPEDEQAPALEASMDGAGNVTMRATLGPADRRILRDLAVTQAKEAAANLNHRGGLLSLFPTNRQTWRVRRTY